MSFFQSSFFLIFQSCANCTRPIYSRSKVIAFEIQVLMRPPPGFLYRISTTIKVAGDVIRISLDVRNTPLSSCQSVLCLAVFRFKRRRRESKQCYKMQKSVFDRKGTLKIIQTSQTSPQSTLMMNKCWPTFCLEVQCVNCAFISHF